MEQHKVTNKQQVVIQTVRLVTNVEQSDKQLKLQIMKTNRKAKLNFAKQTISQFTIKNVKGGAVGGTQSNQQKTGCQTNCSAWKTCQAQ